MAMTSADLIYAFQSNKGLRGVVFDGYDLRGSNIRIKLAGSISLLSDARLCKLYSHKRVKGLRNGSEL